jgi:hAT family C-terminal dimerisation region
MEVANPPKSDLEVYIGEPIYVVEDENFFDVLKWWSQNCSKYHILSKLARDVLCIPITTVASESAFSVGGRVLDDYRSSLKQDMVEILVCGGDWLKAVSKTTIQTLEVNFLFCKLAVFIFIFSAIKIHLNLILCAFLFFQ